MERELIDGIKADLSDAKKALREAERKANALGKINIDAGRAEAANAVYAFEMSMVRTRGQIGIDHAAGARDLLAYYPDDSGPVILGGGR